MSYPVQEEPYLQMMCRFVQGAMNASTFVEQFFALRRQDGEREWALRSTWDKPYDQLLSAALKRGDISADEFAQQWDALFGWSKEHKVLLKMLDRLFSACNDFVDDPALRTNPAREYDAEQLREFVAKELQEYLYASNASCRERQ
jgi:hypothetical protein